jgi:hypothetical protein
MGESVEVKRQRRQSLARQEQQTVTRLAIGRVKHVYKKDQQNGWNLKEEP